jgi:hypothetical protein
MVNTQCTDIFHWKYKQNNSCIKKVKASFKSVNYNSFYLVCLDKITLLVYIISKCYHLDSVASICNGFVLSLLLGFLIILNIHLIIARYRLGDPHKPISGLYHSVIIVPDWNIRRYIKLYQYLLWPLSRR